ncbi:MAG: methionyl-tRNA formyltransferase [Spirochaetales bacterium]|jgi:methionyl-tRNA formyltransferase|nr:methionyl-tRNA formyltransferase [Spirochaetales bacterium]
MRILFAGSPEIALPSLKALAARHDIAGVFTSPDGLKGRGKAARPQPSPVALEAERAGLRVFKPPRLDADARQTAASLGADILVSVAYGRIFGPRFLALFPLGGINLHPSLLPAYRGPSPINACLLRGDRITGVTVIRVAAEVDGGDILLQSAYPLEGGETAPGLGEALGRLGAEILVQAVAGLAAGRLKGRPQDSRQASYCGALKKTDGFIRWDRPAREIERAFRAYLPWPGIYTRWGERRLNILKPAVYTEESPRPAGEGTSPPGTVLALDRTAGFLVSTGEGILAIQELQLESKKAGNFKAFANGNPDFTGSLLGGTP